MDKGEITITQNPANGFMSVQFKLAEDGTVWATKYELAELFNVYPITAGPFIISTCSTSLSSTPKG